MESKVSQVFTLLQECAEQKLLPFKKFDELEPGRSYKINRFMLIHSNYGTKLAIEAQNIDENGGFFILCLPERFNMMANSTRVEQLNSTADKGYMYYVGKNPKQNNRIMIEFTETEAENNMSIDVPY